MFKNIISHNKSIPKSKNKMISITQNFNLSEKSSSLKTTNSNNNLITLKGRFNKMKSKFQSNYLQTQKAINNKSTLININDECNINIEEYLSTEIDDMDYDNAVKRDPRKFCQFFCDKLKNKLIIISTFLISEPLKPKTIKILLFVLDIKLYLFVNALFFNEEYISEIFNSTEEEKFFTFIPRSYNRFFYTTLVGISVNYIVDCFFIEEKKIKGIFIREKNDIIVLKYEISKINSIIKKRYISFIIFSLVISLLILYYIFCFNSIYPHMKNEWIKSSILIIIIMQIVYILEILLETIIRFISFKLKSERIYKISLILS